MKLKLRSQKVSVREPIEPPKPDPLRALAEETGKSVETLRIFAKISDPENAHLFKAEAAYKAFARVKPKP